MDLKIIEDAEKEYIECSKNIDTLEKLEAIRLKFFGKKGLIADIMAKFREVPVELKKEFGQKVNGLKNKIETSIEEIKTELAEKQIENEIKSTKMLDYTLPIDTKTGSLNPRTIIQKQVVDIFKNMGFVIEDGAEVETEYNNFESVFWGLIVDLN